MPTYKSFCWCLGTTSFRTKDFNRTVEEQLGLLNEFWSLEENANEAWVNNSALQIRYYDFMKVKGFVTGDAPRKDKDAREKTSGLVDIGLIDDDRKLTNAGRSLFAISQTGNFESDNVFQIPKDSYIYLKQLLKTSNKIDETVVRPFIVLLRLLSEFESIFFEEYTYLLPLCVDRESTEYIIDKIHDLRNHRIDLNDIIVERLMNMENYQEGLRLFLHNDVDADLICEVGMNRKSRNYDRPYFPLYQALRQAYLENDANAFINVYEATKQISIGIRWRNYLFNTVSMKAISHEPLNCLNATLFDNLGTEAQFKEAFYKVMHLLKAQATLSDYLDLNRRYIKTTDVVLFNDNSLKLDIVPKHFFNAIINNLYSFAFEESALLFDDCALEEIAACLVADENTIIAGVNEELGTNVTTVEAARLALDDVRYRRLQALIDDKFTDEKLIELLNLFESRNDSEIRDMVTDNADIPTIFEYVLGILWYKTSERQGKVLEYMKLSLDADLLPKTHAAGGEADIVYEYAATEYYPEHALLLEVTLADGTNQRRMEMEPVSRHLGTHLLRTKNKNSYCVFAAPYLDINVISDFRGRKNTFFYNTQEHSQFITGMKIIPLQTTELKKIVNNHKTYKELYPLFEELFNSTLPPYEWYNNAILQMTE